MDNKTLVIIPAYNEQEHVASVVDGLKSVGFEDILVIDDGSMDSTRSRATESGAKVVSHPVNMGVGAGTRTGFSYALDNGFDYVLTFDGDGQMRPEDAVKIHMEAQKGYDFVYGRRDFNTASTPWVRRVTNWLADLVTAFLSGRIVWDTQSGLKCINTKLLKKMNLRSSGYSICSELVIESIKSGVVPKPVKIDAIYTKASLKKGQKISNSFRVVKELLG
jgi:glycosyltransferase involved in cell wall biosynthesis